jgi:hypothetical protein
VLPQRFIAVGAIADEFLKFTTIAALKVGQWMPKRKLDH